MGTLTTGRIQNSLSRVVLDLDAPAAGSGLADVLSIKDSTGKLVFKIANNGAMVLSGTIAVLSAESAYQMFSSAQTSYANTYIASATASSAFYAAVFYAPQWHSASDPYKRIRSTAPLNQLVPMIVTATAVVDHHFTLWYRQTSQSSTWYPFISTYDPVGGDGSVTLTAVIGLHVNAGDRIELTATATDSSGNVHNAGKAWLRNFNISAMAINI
jgi:hypothetical protein